MAATKLVFYQDDDGSVPALEWFDSLPRKAQDKCRVRMERLAELGHELRRPETDFLRDGIRELRLSTRGTHYRLLYFFYGTVAAVVSHGLIKERRVPPGEIDKAIVRKRNFERDPDRYTYRED